MTERIGMNGKYWVREFPFYLTSHTPGKQNVKKYINLKPKGKISKSKGAEQNAMRTRRRAQKYKKG